jgi:hypothetical protein
MITTATNYSIQTRTETVMTSTTSSPLIAYLDVDNTLFFPPEWEGRAPTPRPQVVDFLNALYDEQIPVRLYSNNFQVQDHVSINDYLRRNNCKMTLPFPNNDDYYRSRNGGGLSRNDWRRRNPENGIIRMSGESYLEKELMEYLYRGELSKAVLVDDDCGCWIRNFGRFVPALKVDAEVELPGIEEDKYRFKLCVGNCSKDWKEGLMNRILPALLAIRDANKEEASIPPSIVEEKAAALNYAKTLHVDRSVYTAQDIITDGELYNTYVIKQLEGSEGDRLWQRTKLAYPECSMEVILKSLHFTFNRGFKGIAENRYFFCKG